MKKQTTFEEATIKFCDTATACLAYLIDLPHDMKEDLVNDLYNLKKAHHDKSISDRSKPRGDRRHIQTVG